MKHPSIIHLIQTQSDDLQTLILANKFYSKYTVWCVNVPRELKRLILY